jgi:hypothetical protein
MGKTPTSVRAALWVAGCCVIAAPAQALADPIWVQCELGPGEINQNFGVLEDVFLVGTGTFRFYDPARRVLNDDGCAEDDRMTSRCVLTADEFTYDGRMGGQRWRARIDRRTGGASYAYENPERPERSGTVNSLCRGTSDPRPPAQF